MHHTTCVHMHSCSRNMAIYFYIFIYTNQTLYLQQITITLLLASLNRHFSSGLAVGDCRLTQAGLAKIKQGGHAPLLYLLCPLG